MVLSGHIAFYGVHLENDDEMWTFLRKYQLLKFQTILLAHRYDEGSLFGMLPYEIVSTILDYCVIYRPDDEDIKNWGRCDYEQFIAEECNSIEITQQRCCYDDGSRFMGFNLGDTYFAYRDSIDEYATFDSYIQKYYKQLRKIKKTHRKLEEKITEFDKICSVLGYLPLYYTFANDCENCS